MISRKEIFEGLIRKHFFIDDIIKDSLKKTFWSYAIRAMIWVRRKICEPIKKPGRKNMYTKESKMSKNEPEDMVSIKEQTKMHVLYI